jgi:hypothetical protein
MFENVQSPNARCKEADKNTVWCDARITANDRLICVRLCAAVAPDRTRDGPINTVDADLFHHPVGAARKAFGFQ